MEGGGVVRMSRGEGEGKSVRVSSYESEWVEC